MLKRLGSVGMLVLLFWVMADASGLRVFIDIYSLVIVFGGATLFWLAAGGGRTRYNPRFGQLREVRFLLWLAWHCNWGYWNGASLG